MKRFLFFLMAMIMTLPCLASCSHSELEIKQEETLTAEESASETQTAATDEQVCMTPQSDYEKSITKILILGSSSSNDVFFQLGRVFKAQGFGGKRYVLGFLYYSGCKFYQHVDFLRRDDPVYDYYKTSGTDYICEEFSTMKHALKDEQWDVILLHPGGSNDLLHKDLNLNFRREIEAYVNEHVPTEHVFGFHLRCPNPTEDDFFSSSWWRKPPEGYRDNLIKAYGGVDFMKQYSMNVNAVKTHILTDPLYEYNICTGAGFVYAHKMLGVSQFALYRDYTHLSDFGRVLAAYCFYTQFTGEPIEEVKLDKIPAKKRQSHYIADGDLIITDELKHIIKESANYALEHPWDIPQF